MTTNAHNIRCKDSTNSNGFPFIDDKKRAKTERQKNWKRIIIRDVTHLINWFSLAHFFLSIEFNVGNWISALWVSSRTTTKSIFTYIQLSWAIECQTVFRIQGPCMPYWFLNKFKSSLPYTSFVHLLHGSLKKKLLRSFDVWGLSKAFRANFQSWFGRQSPRGGNSWFQIFQKSRSSLLNQCSIYIAIALLVPHNRPQRCPRIPFTPIANSRLKLGIWFRIGTALACMADGENIQHILLTQLLILFIIIYIVDMYSCMACMTVWVDVYCTVYATVCRNHVWSII